MCRRPLEAQSTCVQAAHQSRALSQRPNLKDLLHCQASQNHPPINQFAFPVFKTHKGRESKLIDGFIQNQDNESEGVNTCHVTVCKHAIFCSNRAAIKYG